MRAVTEENQLVLATLQDVFEIIVVSLLFNFDVIRVAVSRRLRVRLEGIGVRGRRDVDREPRIGIVPPDAAEIISALPDHEIIDVHFLEHNAGLDARESRVDNEDFQT